MIKTSKADFKYFVKKCEEYIDQLSLRDFKIYYTYENHPDSYAWILPDVEAGQATIGLSVDWGKQKATKEMLGYCAKHEVLHLLLADLVHVGKYRQSTDFDFTRAQHACIRRLENWN